MQPRKRLNDYVEVLVNVNTYCTFIMREKVAKKKYSQQRIH